MKELEIYKTALEIWKKGSIMDMRAKFANKIACGLCGYFYDCFDIDDISDDLPVIDRLIRRELKNTGRFLFIANSSDTEVRVRLLEEAIKILEDESNT